MGSVFAVRVDVDVDLGFKTGVDMAVDVARRTHEALRPVIDQSHYGRQASRAINSGMEGYQHEKSKVLARHREVEEATGRVRQFAPELSALF